VVFTIAIAEALTGKPLANYWLHSELVYDNGKNMSSESDNNLTLDDLLRRGYTGREIRFMLLSVHYRKPLNFSYKRLDSVRTALRRLDEFTCKLNCLPAGRPHPEVARFVTAMKEQFFDAMDDDLNVSKGMGAVYNFIRKVNPILQMNLLDKDQKQYILEGFGALDQVLGVFRLRGCPLAPDVNALIQKREQARMLKDWQAADAAREELARQGIVVIDTENGPIWKRATDIEQE